MLAEILVAVAAVMTSIGGIIVPIYNHNKTKTKTDDQTKKIMDELERMKKRSESINDLQNKAIKSITLDHLRQIHKDAMGAKEYHRTTWMSFMTCYEAYKDLGGNGEAKAMKADMDSKRDVLMAIKP
jgi:hypothetical protein